MTAPDRPAHDGPPDPLTAEVMPRLVATMSGLVTGQLRMALEQIERAVALLSAALPQPPPYDLVWQTRGVADGFYALEDGLTPAHRSRLEACVAALDRMLEDAAAAANATLPHLP